MGVTNQGTHTNVYVRPVDPTQRRTPPRSGKAKEKGDGLPLRMTLWIIPLKMISIKKEKDKRRPRNIEAKAATITLSALQLIKPCFSTITTTPHDFGKGLMRQISSL